jgi:predicted metal-binding membrane protein
VASSSAIPRLGAGDVIGAWCERHPEWWMLTASLGAWGFLVAAPWGRALSLCTADRVGLATLSPPYETRLLETGVMAIAMMPPLVIFSVRHVAFRSYRDRRSRAIAEFLAGYLGVWIALAAVFFGVLALPPFSGAGDDVSVILIAYAAALVWQLTPWKRIALWRCHRTVPLAAEGWQAVADCLRFGTAIGASCVASCWILMALPLLGAHGFASMACLQAAMLHERYQRQVRPRMTGSVLLLSASFAFTLREFAT